MISKRARRASAPQENLRQFALNNSKGVDGTKAPTNADTVVRASNLVVNPDGSMSLRKPIRYVHNTQSAAHILRTRLYDTAHVLRYSVGDRTSFEILKEDGTNVPIRLKYVNFKGETVTKDYVTSTPEVFYPQGDLQVNNLNTATIIGNCKVDLTIFDTDTTTAINHALYDDPTAPLPRYVQVYYDETDAIWTVFVKSPELNTLTTAEGEIAFNPNLTLDNPFAVRDQYGTVVPAIKGILAYAPSKIVNGKPVPIEDWNSTVSTRGAETFSTAHTGVFETVNTESKVFAISSAHASIALDSSISWTSTAGSPSTVSVSAICRRVPEVGWSPNISEYLDLDVTLRATLNIVGADDSISTIRQYTNRKTLSVFESDLLSEQLLNELKFNATLTVPDGYTVRVAYTIDVSYAFGTEVTPSQTVAEITESTKAERYRPVITFDASVASDFVLKAFCNLPSTKYDSPVSYYATWLKSKDTVHWEPLHSFTRYDGIAVRELDPMWAPDEYVENDTPEADDYITTPYYPLQAYDENDLAFTEESINARIDTVPMLETEATATAATYRFRIVAVTELVESDPEFDNTEGAPEKQYKLYATVSQADYTPVFGSEFEFFDTEFANTVLGKKLYHKKAIYSYGSEKFKNNIFVSDIDSFVTPLYNIIDLDAYAASSVTCVIPWRDYLVSATENAVYLHTRQSDGYLTKTVNTSVGISAEDARCCKAILNGILFKSGTKIYQMYPNLYAGDDSTLNLTEISAPVEEYLLEYAVFEEHPFALSTESEYVLMLPRESDTLCLRYNYSSKLWTVYTYPVLFTDYKLLNLDNIRLFGYYDDFYAEYIFDAEPIEDMDYGDAILDTIVPIEFEWDTGQKTDGISAAKQFVESKLVFATEDELEAFPMSLIVTVDGDPHVTTVDVNTDAPFWKNHPDARGVVGTAFRLSSGGDTGVLRQLIVRYSGKGRSVRHILTGAPTSNFRLYETYVRYKNLNIKK